MYRQLGLTRDPFLTGHDDALYLELGERRQLRREAEKLLSSGASVFVTGPRGSGREAFAANLCEKMADTSASALMVRGAGVRSGAALLALIHAHLYPGPIPADRQRACEAVYRAMLAAKKERRVILCLPKVGQVAPAAYGELACLLGQRLKDEPVASAIISGDTGQVAPEGFETLALEPLQQVELADIIRHRLGLCGGHRLFTGAEVDAIAAGSAGIADALGRSAWALNRKAFELSSGREQSAAAPPGKRGIFSADALGEVSKLLGAISTDKGK